MQFVKDLISKVAPNNFLKLQQNIVIVDGIENRDFQILFSMPTYVWAKRLYWVCSSISGSINFITASE
ncbi:hypothetical protein DSOL_5417 [Desulfosporosinus metallidurans]|uniref:Uncharacterized protein n=2 Tax=Desulfosporosinus metallidurans TaxID=1888891 RepID=A0A1Q8QBE6_9FIRM|nr:hypothetical protein DSOL_5417 [Desulfosporosinus metallidurans]